MGKKVKRLQLKLYSIASEITNNYTPLSFLLSYQSIPFIAIKKIHETNPRKPNCYRIQLYENCLSLTLKFVCANSQEC